MKSQINLSKCFLRLSVHGKIATECMCACKRATETEDLGLVWQRHVHNRTEQSSVLLVLELVKSDDVI